LGSFKKTIKYIAPSKRKIIDKIITLEMAPVLPISKVEAKALGISATIPEK